MKSVVKGGMYSFGGRLGGAALFAASLGFLGASASAETAPEFEDVAVVLLWEEAPGYDGPIEGEDYVESDDWDKEEWVAEDSLPEWEDWIAWSGIPEGEDGVLYMTGDWLKRGGGDGAVAPVPLPGAGLLLIGGIAGLAALRRRRG